MKKYCTLTRRSFIKVSAMLCGYSLLGFNMAKTAVAAAVDFVGNRQKQVYATDANDTIYPIKKSQENPMITALYDADKGFLKEGPCGEHSHHLLHTHYHDRSAGVKALKDKGVTLAL